MSSVLEWYLPLENALTGWNPTHHVSDAATAEEERRQILAEFPLSDWPALAVERFAQGASSTGTSFCTWLEGKSPNLGSLPARKADIHLIYKEGGKTWRFPGSFKNVEEAWKAVRGGYVRAFELAEARKWADIDALPVFKSGSLTLHKALHVYFPARVLPISANNHLVFFAQRVFRSEWKQVEKLGHCALNAALLAKLRTFPELASASTTQLMWFLYDWTDVRKTPRVVKIPPGEDAKYWKDCRDGGYISIGWDETGSLEKFSKLQDFRPVFEKHFSALYKGSQPQVTVKSQEVWQMKTIEPGSIVLANKGTSRLVGIGVVTDPGYVWLGDRKEYKHGLKVQWEPGTERDIPSQGYWAFKTVLDIAPSQFDEVLGGIVTSSKEEDSQAPIDDKRTFDIVMAALAKEKLFFPEETVANFLLSLQAKRFVILTGISGTGKTQLAMAVASCFPLVRSVAVEPELGDEAMVIQVKPYMTRHHRFVLPAALAAGVPPLDDGKRAGTIRARYPAGEEVLSIWWDDALTVMLKGGLRSWFESTAARDGRFVVRTELVPDNAEVVLVLEPAPAAKVTTTVKNAEVVAVRPDWSDNRGLLGFLSPITGCYSVTPLLRLLLGAAEEVERATVEKRAPHPFFVVLDEMNLARVEHYFSDFLSCLESRKKLHLHDSVAVEEGQAPDGVAVPREIAVPPNLHFVGTVNVDETTYMFSPKVLDRAFCIELNDVDLLGFGAKADAAALRLDKWSGRLEPGEKPGMADWTELGKGGDLLDPLVRLHAVLQMENRHFGYRVAGEIARFVNLARAQCGDADAARVALDLAVLQKVLPKLSGTQQELTTLLANLHAAAVGLPDDARVDEWTHHPDGTWRKGETAVPTLLPRTAARLSRMRRRLAAHGFAAFIE